MLFSFFSFFVWLVACGNLLFSISITEGYRYTSLLIFFISLIFFVFNVKKNINFNKQELWIVIPYLLFFASQVLSEYLDILSLPDPFLAARFIIALPVLYLLLNVFDHKYLLWYGVILGSVGAFVFALYEVIYLGEHRAGGGILIIMFGDISILLSALGLVSSLYFFSEKKYFWFALSVFSVFCALGSSILSGTRGGWIAFPIVLFFVLFHSRSLFKKRFLIFLFSSIFFISALIAFNPNFSVYKRVETAVNQVVAYSKGEAKNSSVGLRFEMWKFSGCLFENSPFFGVGKTNDIAKQQCVDERGYPQQVLNFKHVHNEFLDAFAYKGVFGALFLLVIYLIPFIAFYKKIKLYEFDYKIKCYAVAGAVIPICYFIFGLTEVLFVNKIGVTMYAFPIVFFWASLRLAEKKIRRADFS